MREPGDQPTTQAFVAFDRRRMLEEIRARLSAISATLADPHIDAAQLRRDARELDAVKDRIEWLADASTH